MTPINIEETADRLVLVAPRERRASLVVGMLARLLFIDGARRERLWFEISERIEGPSLRYRGVLVSESCADDVELGHSVEFGPEHICEWDVVVVNKPRVRAGRR